MSQQRLHKILAEAGIGSRRKCEEIIQEGRVEVDGEFVTELGVQIDPDKQKITVDGQRVKIRGKKYFALNKPPGVLSTNFDPDGRMRVIDLVPQEERLFTIGRLDRGSEGLIIVTNDGELSNRLAHPRYGVAKTYHVEVAGHPTVDDIKAIRAGVHFAEGFVKPETARMKKKNKHSTTLEIILREGKNREIRRLLARVGHKVQRLKRISIGPLKLGEMPTGAFRELTAEEIKALRLSATSGSSPRRSPKSGPRKNTLSKTGSNQAAAKKKKSKRKKTTQSEVYESRRGFGRTVAQKRASRRKARKS